VLKVKKKRKKKRKKKKTIEKKEKGEGEKVRRWKELTSAREPNCKRSNRNGKRVCG